MVASGKMENAATRLALALPHPCPRPFRPSGGEAFNPICQEKEQRGHKKLKKISQPIVKIYKSLFLEI